MTSPKRLATTGGGAGPLYVDDVFSTWLYTGNGSTQTITNGIDLASSGGMVWIKSRSAAKSHALYDTVRGGTGEVILRTNTDNGAANTFTDGGLGFSASGFSLSADTSTGAVNDNGVTFASWTFRRASKFFDIVTYTGDGNLFRDVPHSLSSAPGMIICKRTDNAGNWAVWHRGSSPSGDAYGSLSINSGQLASITSTTFTSTSFKPGLVSDFNGVGSNETGASYVAYLFAHNAGGFGESGNENIISCGTYTGNGTSNAGPDINVGFEPQWVLIKKVRDPNLGLGAWDLFDDIRGIPYEGIEAAGRLRASTSAAENRDGANFNLTSTGFRIISPFDNVNANGATYIYVAIRRPNKPPKTGTEVLSILNPANTTSGVFQTSSVLVDTVIAKPLSTSLNPSVASRLTGDAYMSTNGTFVENNDGTYSISFDSNRGYRVSGSATPFNSSNTINYMLRRAAKFFDTVCYTGTGSNRTVNHNLGATPGLMIVKRRTDTGADWAVYSASIGANSRSSLNSAQGFFTDANAWNNTAPTSSVFTVGTSSTVNALDGRYIAYLFASLPGVSSVGTYSGNGSNQVINCGFTSGARFVLIKRTNTTGGWFVFDTNRGINPIGTNDPYLLLNSSGVQITNTDNVSASSSGFGVVQNTNNNLNATGSTYIYLAIA